MSSPRSWRSRFKLTIGISLRKIILEVEYVIKSMIYQMLKFFRRIAFHPEMILRPLFCFKDTKNTGSLTFNSLKRKKLIFNFFVNRNWKKLTDSRKRAKILADNRKSHHPVETLFYLRCVTIGDCKMPLVTSEYRRHGLEVFPSRGYFEWPRWVHDLPHSAAL